RRLSRALSAFLLPGLPAGVLPRHLRLPFLDERRLPLGVAVAGGPPRLDAVRTEMAEARPQFAPRRHRLPPFVTGDADRPDDPARLDALLVAIDDRQLLFLADRIA